MPPNSRLDGNWGIVFRFAIAALVCGLVWETWNYYSLAKWIYNVPWAERFKVWEMPVMGFAGYLPFGMECAAIAHWISPKLVTSEASRVKTLGVPNDYLKFRNTLDKSGALAKTVMFVHTAADPIVECMLVPDVSLAVAEKFALEGKNVLVLLADMTSFADAMKEIAITFGQHPARAGARPRLEDPRRELREGRGRHPLEALRHVLACEIVV